MKILAIGDPHGKLPLGLSKIIKRNKIELIIVTGEIPPVPFQKYYPKNMRKEYDSSWGDSRYKFLLDKLCSYGFPVIILKGNAYMSLRGTKYTNKLFKQYKNLFYNQTGKFGFNKKNLISFDMFWEKWSSKQINKKFFERVTKKNNLRLNKLKKLFNQIENPILITHSPPYGILDNVKSVGHVGSKKILKFIKKYQPKIVFCGHIHEGRGKKKIGKSLVINCGSRGDYIVYDLDQNKIMESNFLK